MAEKTRHLGMTLPAGTEAVDVEVLNENAELIDMAIEELQDTANVLDAKIAEVRGSVETNADAITALSEHVADATVTAASMSGDYIEAWNAFHHWREGNTLHINGNFKINSDVPAGATLITLPLTVYWGYCIVVHGGKWHMAQLTGNMLRLPAGIALATADGVNVTVIATGRINAGA